MVHTVRRRGATIQGLQCGIKALLEELYEANSNRFVEITGDPLQDGEGQDVTEFIRDLQQKIREKPPSAAQDVGTFGCNSCWENFNNDTKLPCTFQCGHVYCIECLPKFAKLECPTCRKRIERVVRIYM